MLSFLLIGPNLSKATAINFIIIHLTVNANSNQNAYDLKSCSSINQVVGDHEHSKPPMTLNQDHRASISLNSINHVKSGINLFQLEYRAFFLIL